MRSAACTGQRATPLHPRAVMPACILIVLLVLTPNLAMSAAPVEPLLGSASASSFAQLPRGPQPAGTIRDSALVRLDVPGVLERWRASTGRAGLGGDARSVAEAARRDRRALAAYRQQVAESVDRAARAVEQHGAQVVGRYHVVAAGLRVHGTAAQVRAIEHIPGVAFVEPGPRVAPALERSVPSVGAERVRGLYGWDGAGSVVAVVDTGIDYTHADLGGPGTAAAYAAAAGAAERIDDRWQGELLFPNAKVVGGYDFVGPNYTSPAHCPPALEAAGRCTSTPHPDDDPLDGHGHGTHVAGIAAGAGSAGVPAGVAPGASLVALKLYGPPAGGVFADESVDGLVDAIEWCVAANLGLETRGVVPEFVDVVNISLGEPWAQGSKLFDAAVEAATDAGVTLVATAGNQRDIPYILGAPGSSPRVLSVAGSTTPPDQAALRVLPSDGGAGWRVPIELGPLSAPLAAASPLEAPATIAGRACPGDGLTAGMLDGAVALIEGGGCPTMAKAIAARDAGALAVIVRSARNDDAGPDLSGDSGVVGIPVVGVRAEIGRELFQAIGVTAPPRFRLDETLRVPDPAHGAALASFSARGPSRAGALKPDLAAPGSSITSADRGSGDGQRRLSGTSMSAPHVAGAAAVLRQASREGGEVLAALDLAAMLMSSARPDLAAGSLRAPVARQGAGRLDLARAVSARLGVRVGAIASIDLGAPALTGSRTITRVLELTNRGATELAVHVRNAPRDPNAAGLALRPIDAPIRLAPGASGTVPVAFELDPAALPAWPFDPSGGPASIEAGLMDRFVRDGWLELHDAAVGAAPPTDTLPAAVVPYRALPRAASALRLAWSPGLLQWQNDGAMAGRALLFDGNRLDPDEPDLRAEADLEGVGARFERRAEGTGPPDTLALAFIRHESAVLPHTTLLAAFLDLDGDGAVDWRIAAGPEAAVAGSGSDRRLGVAAVRWDPERDEAAGAPIAVAPWPATLHARVALVRVPLSVFGEQTPSSLALYASAEGLDETWWRAPAVDLVPDDALATTSGWLTIAASATARLDGPGVVAPNASGAVVAPAQCRDDAASRPSGDEGPEAGNDREPNATVLAVFPDNPADPERGEPGSWALLTGTDARLIGAPIPELGLPRPCRAYLPWGGVPDPAEQE